MARISFEPALPLIVLPITISDINADIFRDVIVALDTGATITIIPIPSFRQKLLLLWVTIQRTQIDRCNFSLQAVLPLQNSLRSGS